MAAIEKPFRPSLACGDASWDDFKRIIVDQEDVMFASPKLDGIRAVVKDGKLISRTLKPIRNRHTQALFGIRDLEGLDGELIVGAAYGEGVFARTSSGVMSEFGEPDVRYFVFDDFNLGLGGVPYINRYEALDMVAKSNSRTKVWPEQVHLLDQKCISELTRLQELEEHWVTKGFEGAILRWAHAPYKQGRSTLRERYMLKLKRFKDSEGRIEGFEELMHNDNEATVDSRGYTARSSHKANKRAAGTLGKLVVQDIHNPDWCPRVGTGFDAALRQEIWDNQEKYLGKTIKYTYLPVGTVDQPRHPVFRGFRDPDDIS